MFTVPRNIKAGLKEGTTTILVSSVRAPSDLTRDTPIIEDIKTVSSYNWLAEHETDYNVPTIQVPGAPPILHLPKGKPPMKLEADTGHHFIDQNASRMKGNSGLIPGLAACHAYKRDFKITDYDVITDRNNLIKLFELIELSLVGTKDAVTPATSTPWRAPSIEAAAARRDRGGWRGRGRGRGRGGGSGGNGGAHPFFQQLGARQGMGIESMDRRAETTRIDIDVVSGYDNDTGKYIYDENPTTKKTLVMTRWEPKNEEVVISQIDFRGFGHSFLTETRQFLSFEDGRVFQKGANDVTGYHCLVEYKLFGMKLLVRYHADACDMTKEEFVKWISQDAIHDLSGSDTQSEGSEGEEDESDNPDRTLFESPTTDTFDLLDAFKTLSVKTERPSNEKLLSKLKLSTPQHNNPDVVSLPKIPMDIIPTPNAVFPGEKILQVKTRGKHTGLNRERLYTQLFFSQTRNVFVAYHTRGVFSETETSKEDITAGMSKWADDNKELLKRLTSIFRQVKETVGGMGGKGAIGFLLRKKASDDPVVIDIQGRDD
ncbi:hypothetical protein TWF679_005326 [Orbilia oligospora]|uniref:Uncharacterized protein n=1 Tax=Orbilia oligospora TaxID=2813651 RepID=A0A8H8VCH6_ORBOL|nr:hypothetical protein TWF679_005326 [Orbilia oligospora]